MTSLIGQLQVFFTAALVQVMGDDGQAVDPLLRAAGDPKFGDYQSNVAMSLAKRIKSKPRDVAQQVIDALPEEADALIEKLEIAGPGFINIYLKDDYLATGVNAIPTIPASDRDDRLGIEAATEPQTVVVDYSGPNIAKQMHVGHLRSTIIGDTLARVLAFQGHNVVRQNHIGDWGTQFGMLIAYLRQEMPGALDTTGDQPSSVHVSDLEGFYRKANALDKEDPEFHETARAAVVALHNHDSENVKAWQYIVEESRRHYIPIYKRLNVSLTRDDERGESFYAERLAGVVEELEKNCNPSMNHPRICVRESEGALCIFHTDENGKPQFTKPEGDPFPMIIRKSDGAFLYATTDMAALKYRTQELEADRIIYVTDARQALHFEMVFAAADGVAWTARESKPAVKLEHVPFGSILGEDRKPLKTRSGDNIKLADLLVEAVDRAEQLIRTGEADEKKRRGFDEAEIKDIAEAVGIGAVKYADLSQNRQSDYVFSWNKMLAMEGNTAPYMMYAYARIRSIHRKGAEGAPPVDVPIALTEPNERRLALQLLRFAEMIENVADGLKINLLTDYLYELAGSFMKFYETCSVLKADTDEQRASRLKLCDLTARTLRTGLDLLGIRTVEQM